jgi:6-phosphogluconate dehydrogenase
MGKNIAFNFAGRGHRVVAHDLDPERAEELAQSDEARGLEIVAAADVADLVGALERPRALFLMVPAGDPVDAVLDGVVDHLQPGDVVVDGGNSLWEDTKRREAALAERGLVFVGAGVSGGQLGALKGPSIMVGGAPEGWARVGEILQSAAARVDGRPCCDHLGPGPSGHFVKMVHNGIEYAVMQLISEAYLLMHRVMGMSHDEMSQAFSTWAQGELSSYLVEIAADVLAKRDPESGEPLLELVLDRAGQKGTGRWTAIAALELGVTAPTIVEAVMARSLSSFKPERQATARAVRGDTLGAPRADLLAQDLPAALLAATLLAYDQGYALLQAASDAHSWDLDLGQISRVWSGGCIIRAAFLTDIAAAYEGDSEPLNLTLADGVGGSITGGQAALRRIAAAFGGAGVPAPAFASSLAYFDGLRTARGGAHMLQALRDTFGAHTYERVDREGTFHSDWRS